MNNLGRASRSNSVSLPDVAGNATSGGTQASGGVADAPPLGIGAPAQVEHGQPLLQLTEQGAPPQQIRRRVGPRLDLVPLDALRVISGLLGEVGTAQLAPAHKGIGEDLKKVKPEQAGAPEGLRRALGQALEQQEVLQRDYGTTNALRFKARSAIAKQLKTVGQVVDKLSHDWEIDKSLNRLPRNVQAKGWLRFHDGTLSGLKSPIRPTLMDKILAWEVAGRVDALLKAGLTKEALNLAASVVSLNPAHPTAICSLIRVLMHEGKLAEASRVADRLLANEAVEHFDPVSRETLAVLAFRTHNREHIAAIRGADVSPLTEIQKTALSTNKADDVIASLTPVRDRILGGDEESAYQAHLELANFASSMYVTPQVRADPKWKAFLFDLGHSTAQMEASVEPDKSVQAFDADFPFHTLVFPRGGPETGSRASQFFHTSLAWEMFALNCETLKKSRNELLEANPASQREVYQKRLRPELEGIGIGASLLLKIDKAYADEDHGELVRLAQELEGGGQMIRQLFTRSMRQQGLQMPQGWKG